RPGGSLDPAADSQVVVAAGACIDNVFWAPVGGTTVGANANFVGTIFRGVADGLSITFGDSSTLIGRALAYGSTVTTANTTITVPDPCAIGDTITVNKDFIPNSTATVPVELTCSSGTVTATPLNASESSPAVFTVTGASPGATCTATETVPTGYTAAQADCVGVAMGGSCTITNTLDSETIVVNKDFIPDSTATVPVELLCTSGTVTTTPLNASESSPAVFTVTGASPGATCTATETVPGGYTAAQADCISVALGGSCTITNTLDSNTIVVNKDFIPDSTATVPVELTCSSGTVTTTPLNASESSPAVFTVTSASPGTTCTATETVPNGYTAEQTDCASVALGGSCTITNRSDSVAATPIPTFNRYGMALLALLMLGVGFVGFRRFS
ncbi:MAG: IPTL-CTERM sorting domain-containing protein, partial [Dokdonella sp.]